MPSSDRVWVLDEDEALELLAYLLTAARTQVDEAAEYGPLRLLTAAHRLADRIAPRSSGGTAASPPSEGALVVTVMRSPPCGRPRPSTWPGRRDSRGP